MPSKAEELASMDASYERLMEIVHPIDDAHGTWNEAHGTWSIVNLLQHMDGWLREMTPALERLTRGERPTPEGIDWSNVDAWNAKFVEEHGEQTMAQAVATIQESYAAFRDAANAVEADRFGEEKTANRLVVATGTNHFTEHAEDIAKFLAGTH